MLVGAVEEGRYYLRGGEKARRPPARPPRASLNGEALARALARLQQEGHPFPFAYALRRFLASGIAEMIFAYLGGDLIRRNRMASFEMTEILRLQLETCPKPGSSQLHGTSPGNPPPFA